MNSYSKIYIFTVGIFKILKNKASRSIFWISAIKKMAKIWNFCEFFHFYPTLDYHKIRTRTNFENPNGKNLDLHLIMWLMLKKLFWGSTDFTEDISKIPQISKHFSAMLIHCKTVKVSQNDQIQMQTWFTSGFLINGTELRSFSHFQILTWIAYSDLSRKLENWLFLEFFFINCKTVKVSQNDQIRM